MSGLVVEFRQKDTKREVIRYKEMKADLRNASPEHADRIIEIIERESWDYNRRMAFMETTYREIRAGADYSKCKTIDDISRVFAENLLRRLGF